MREILQKRNKFYSGTAEPPADHRVGVMNFIVFILLFPENKERSESVWVERESVREGSWEMVGRLGLYVFIPL